MNFRNPIFFVLFLLISLSTFTPITGQEFYFKSYGGVFYYQGDLAPKPIDISFGPGKWTWGFSTGYGVTKWLNMHLRFMKGNISGDDALSESNERRTRNLSFKSHLHEYGTYGEVNINQFWKSLDKYKLRLYLSAGINLITFNPQTYFDNKWVYLQPLGTEGQTLPTSVNEPYSLSALSRSTGINVEFDFTKTIALGLEFNTRKTWTDYLDDVSTSYPDREAMLASGNILGAKLSDRSGEYFGTGIPTRAPNSPRGRQDKNDWYTFFGLYLKLTFGKNQTSEPQAAPSVQ